MGLIAPEMLLEILGDKVEERQKETRPIDAEDLLEKINELKESPWFNEGKELRTISYVARKEAVEIIEDLCIKQQPTVERPKGEWIYNKIGYPYVYTCSECGYHNDIKNRFCPYCGADMRGEE